MIATATQKLRRTLITISFFVVCLVFFGGQALGDSGISITENLGLWEAVILGIVEGFTEFLPISSTGHLLAAKEFLDLGQTEITEEAIDSYIISIQIGAIFAVAVLYRNRLHQMMQGLRGNSPEGRQILTSLVIAFIPTALIGYLTSDFVKDELYGLSPVAAAWIVGGICILVVQKKQLFQNQGSSLEGLSFFQAGIIGLVQALAIWPGVSRSLVTILAAVFIGLSLKAAVEFSFLLGLVTLAAATVYEMSTDGSEIIDNFGYLSPAVGLVVAFVSAIISVRWMVDWLEKRSFNIFGYYRIIIGLVAFLLLSIGFF